MAIKVMGISPEASRKRCDDDAGRAAPSSQDFLMVNGEAFFNRDVFEYEEFFHYQSQGVVQQVFYFIKWNPFRWRLGQMITALRMTMQEVSNPLDLQYFSGLPFKLGPHNTKYSARPCDGQTFAGAEDGPHFLREAMVNHLAEKPACFDFLVQVQNPEANQPLEDSTVVWEERDAPFQKVARIEIPPQVFSTDAQNQFCEQLSFAPWQGLPDHRPLGGLNRARKAVYEAVSKRRHARNGVRRCEPPGLVPRPRGRVLRGRARELLHGRGRGDPVSASYTRDFEEVLAVERERIESQRRRRGSQQDSTVGLALSGGGLRSSSFAVGVLQALERGDLLRRIDYLSSVSGGSYIAAALTWFRRRGEERFPFGVRGVGLRRTPPSSAEAEPAGILGYLRQHGDYLTPAGGSDARNEGGVGPDRGARVRTAVPPMAYGGLVARAVFLSVFVYGSMLVGVFMGLELLDRFLTMIAPVLAAMYPTPTWSTIVGHLNFALLTGVALVAALALAWAAHPVVAWVMRRWRDRRPGDEDETNRAYAVGMWAQGWTGRLLGSALVVGVVGSVPIVVEAVGTRLPDRWAIGMTAATAIAVGVALGIATFRSNRRRRSEAAPRPAVAALRVVRDAAAAVLMLYGLLSFSYVLAVGLLNSGALGTGLVVIAIGVASGWLADLNQMGISRMYRDRLMEAFLPSERAIARNQWLPGFDANVAPLESMASADTLGPYPLLNSNLVTLGSRRTRFRSRGGDSFVLAPLYCGSDATGWRRTRDWMGGRLTLATAMAISGPTAQPAAAPEGRGWRRRLVSAAMFSLGLRPSFWARSPNPKHRGREAAPSYVDPGLMRGIFGRGRHEGGRFVELSDGAEFEDLGIYELIRRRVDVIIAADASDDADYTHEALANAVERARVDFGVDIAFPEEQGLEGIRPGAADAQAPGLAQRGFAVGTIRYTDEKGGFEKEGVLLYLKATMIEGLPPDVLGYRGRRPDFPHESIDAGDFSEARFEAHRELGYRITRQLIDENARREAEGSRPGARQTCWL